MARKLSPTRQATLDARARQMRLQPTPSELLLWRELKGARLGVAFRRQAVVGECVVDFLAPSVRLVVEVDGGYHAQRGRADARRERLLRRAGYRVLRLPAALVLQRLREAVERVRGALGG